MKNNKEFSQIGVIFAIYVVFNTLVSLFLTKIYRSGISATVNINIIMLISIFVQYALGFPLTLLLFKKNKAYDKREVSHNKLTGKHFLIFLSLIFFGMMTGSIISSIIVEFIMNVSSAEKTNVLGLIMMNLNPALLIAFVGILGPVVEEILFRKIVISRTLVYGDGVAIIFSAATFALMHGNLEQIFYAFIIGMILAYVYIRTGKLAYTIALHIIVNMSSVFLVLMVRRLGIADYLSGGIVSMNSQQALIDLIDTMSKHGGALAAIIIYVVVYFTLAITGFVLAIRLRKQLILNKGSLSNASTGEKNSLMFLNAGMLAFIAVSIFMMVDNLGLIPAGFFGM